MRRTIAFELNGKPVSITDDDERSLLWVLRGDFGLTGTKFGCGRDLCGACTVLVDDQSERSCVLRLRTVEGKKVRTIEGLARNGELHPLQQAFVEHDAMQCGYCTPGMIMEAYSLLRRHPAPTRAEIIEGMEANLCRCGAHTRIVRAIQAAAAQMKEGVSR